MSTIIAASASLIFWAGVGQFLLAVASLAIPRVLRWSEDLAHLTPLNRQLFWTYAAYICSAHVAFAVLSMAVPGELVDGSLLATAVTSFIACWWGARLVLQFTSFHRVSPVSGFRYRLAEAALVALFTALTLVYTLAAIANLGGGAK